MSGDNGGKTEEYQKKPGGTFKEGNPGGGRPPGAKNWSTVFNEALKKIADANDKSPEEIRVMLQEVGINKALRGDHRFWSELQKREYGDIKKEVHVTTDDEPSDRIKELAEHLNED